MLAVAAAASETSATMAARDEYNGCRWPRDGGGHYESWFCRANSADGDQAFWIRYTIFEPAGAPEQAVGERWAIYFDRPRRRIIAVKDVTAIAQCRFAARGLDVAIGDATLDDGALRGEAATEAHRIGWDLTYGGGAEPLLLLPARLYETKLPKAKALVGRPLATFSGTLRVDDETIEVTDWVGSHNHNWGRKHTDHYAWGQVAGFDEAPEAFLECSTARLKLGPIWTPFMSPFVLRLPGRTLALNALGRAVRARGRFRPFQWTIETGDRDCEVSMRMSAPASEFVALRYGNPPGGIKTCLNSKVARCEVTVKVSGEPTRTLTSSRAAFEILTDADDHGLTHAV